MIENYIVKDKTIIFSPYLNKEIKPELLEKYSNVIFSNYESNVKLFECYEKNDFKKLNIIGSRFNQQVNLPQNLTFSRTFNQEVNLPFSVKFLELNSNNVNIIDYLPYSVEELIFGYCLNLGLNDLPNSTKNLL